VPEISFGHLEKFKNSAIDLSVGLGSLIIASQVSANANYLKYLGVDNYYLGSGAGVTAGFISAQPVIFSASPTICFGRETGNSFHQINCNVIHVSSVGALYAPSFSYQYGFKF
jgi:hypothetical protein